MLDTVEKPIPELTTSLTSNPKRKKTETRKKILQAAQQIFAQHPYNNASIRMIGNLAGIDHPLINYYFSSKAGLFQTVIAEMLETRKQLQKTWFTKAKAMGTVPERMSLFIDYILEDYRKRPGLLHIVSLNLPQFSASKPIKGFELIQEFVQTDLGGMKEHLELHVSDREGEMFVRALSMLLIGFLGGSGSYASLMKMEPDSILYYNWVKDTILFTLLPRFEAMVKK